MTPNGHPRIYTTLTDVTQIDQHVETTDFLWQVIMQVGQQMADEVQIRQV